MFGGSATGRAFESQAGAFLFIIIIVITVVLWFVFDHAHRRGDRSKESDEDS